MTLSRPRRTSVAVLLALLLAVPIALSAEPAGIRRVRPRARRVYGDCHDCAGPATRPRGLRRRGPPRRGGWTAAGRSRAVARPSEGRLDGKGIATVGQAQQGRQDRTAAGRRAGRGWLHRVALVRRAGRHPRRAVPDRAAQLRDRQARGDRPLRRRAARSSR